MQTKTAAPKNVILDSAVLSNYNNKIQQEMEQSHHWLPNTLSPCNHSLSRTFTGDFISEVPVTCSRIRAAGPVPELTSGLGVPGLSCGVSFSAIDADVQTKKVEQGGHRESNNPFIYKSCWHPVIHHPSTPAVIPSEHGGADDVVDN
ncbi:hypothetical protein E3N88_08360 [Mikania micrantha]|uniref:Uncharacterized protein n=1 Tax=Mikania micrantha TaxID=192012 RepID=A0A5N6PG24_9ASTR|nr:hypothetical protein E3N88_08360 [Mikania micrantha]